MGTTSATRTTSDLGYSAAFLAQTLHGAHRDSMATAAAGAVEDAQLTAATAGVLEARHHRRAQPDAAIAASCQHAYYAAHMAERLAQVLTAAGYTTTAALTARDWRALRQLAGLTQQQAPPDYVREMLDGLLTCTR